MDQGEDIIASATYQLTWTRMRMYITRQAAQECLWIATQSESRVCESRRKLQRTDALLHELERHLPGYGRALEAFSKESR